LIAGSSESSKIKDLTKNQDFVKSFIDNFEQIYNSISSVNPIKKLEIRIAELKSKSNLSLVDLDELDNLKEKLRLLKNENISNLKKAESRIVVNSYKNLDTIKTITNIKNSIPAKVLSSHSDIDNLLIQAD
jgi:hypothetical protein